MTLDSGSAISACPESVGAHFGFSAPATGYKYVTADGRASVPDMGRRRLKVVTEEGIAAHMDMRVAGVHKTLVAAGDMTDKGHIIVLSKFGSFVAHDPQGSMHRSVYKQSLNKPGFWLYKKMGCTFSRFGTDPRDSHRAQQE